MRQLAAEYRPKGVRDHLFLHGLAILAARQALRAGDSRAGDSLYVPREWEGDPSDRAGDGDD